MVISQFDPEEEARLIAGFYKKMSARKPFIEWFKGYVQKKDDADFILDMEVARLEILRECVIKLLNYGYNKKNAVFTKQRHWEAVYRVAADYGFVIDGDYDYFKRVIDDMYIQNLPCALTKNFLDNNNTGIYVQNMKDWTSEGLAGKALAEYEDIKKSAKVFENIVVHRIKTKR